MIDYKKISNKKERKPDIKQKLKTVGIVFIVLLLFGVLTAFAYFYTGYTKKHYVLRYVAITGNKVLTPTKIKKITHLNKPLSMYDCNEKTIYSELIINPWIKRAYVAKLYPDTIYIKIDEWSPKGVVVIGKKKILVNKNGNAIDTYNKNLDVDIERLPLIVLKNSNHIKNFLIQSIINVYEKLDKLDKINYIEVISDSYQLVHFRNSLNIAVDSLNCPDKAFVHLRKEWSDLVSKKAKLDSVSICFDNKFVLRWKKERKSGGNQ